MSKSYEYNGKTYDFKLSMQAKLKIENLQSSQSMSALKNPALMKLAKSVKEKGASLTDMNEAQILDMLPELEGLDGLDSLQGQKDLDPIETGFIVLSTYPPYRDEVTRDFFNALVDDMDVKLGAVDTFAFFAEVQDEVFTQLAEMEKIQTAKAEAQAQRQMFLDNKK